MILTGQKSEMLNRTRSLLILLGIAFAMTVLFWWPLYQGAGFIGGDLYPYFFPQKAFFADNLKLGKLPLWNDLSGFGYPVLGESQTGAAYPFHVALYYAFDLNTAYNIEHLVHYLICFAGTWLFAKRVGLSTAGAYLSAVVFTYGWFPPRACLEWAILTGAWMPVALWCVESLLQTGLWRYAIGLSITLGLQLLAGHFHLAFITLLLVATYPAFRLFGHRLTRPGPSTISSQSCRTRISLSLIGALVAAACLASPQLLPTWELKQRSTRVITGGEYDPGYGHLPPIYISQVVLPWCWYNLLDVGEDNLVRDLSEFVAPWHWFGPRLETNDSSRPYDLDHAIQKPGLATVPVGTNKVEAHFYCGMIPVSLALALIVIWARGLLKRQTSKSEPSILDQTTGYWLVVSLFALLYATGLLLPIGRHLPGFSFFRGPGRYGIVPSLAIALFAGQMLSQLTLRLSTRFTRALLLVLVFSSTCGDLWLVSRMVRYAVMVSPPRIAFRESSIVRKQLLAEKQIPRLLAPGPNVANLLGVSCVPWYLGMAPAEFVDAQNAMPPIPKPLAGQTATPGSPELIEWLSRSGVTHVLNFEPLDEASWQVHLIWKGMDEFLNRVWARQEPIYLYKFRSNPSEETAAPFLGRAAITDTDIRVTVPNWTKAPPDERRLELSSAPTANSVMVLKELAYPGWSVRQGSKQLEAKNEGMFRAVELSETSEEVVWSYHPRSVYCGAILSMITILLLAALAHLRFWHPTFVEKCVCQILPKRTADESKSV